MTEKPLNVFQMLILKALNTASLHKHVYSGTVREFRPHEVERRRKANKVARVSRRKNRK